MAKRSTIGVNPLDAQVQDNPLEAVVSGPGFTPRGTQPPVAELGEETKARLQQLESGISGVREEVARFRGEMTSLRGDLTSVRGEANQSRTEVAPLKAEMAALKAELTRLHADLAALRAELSRLQAHSTPSDIPWWMGGGKKK